MTPWILAVLGLWLGQVFLAASFKTMLAPDPQAATADHLRGKDAAPEPSKVGGRAQRAKDNLQESLPIFLAVALLLEFQGDAGLLAQAGAATFLVARVLYVPAYLSAVFGLRSAVWTVGLVGLGIMVAALFV